MFQNVIKARSIFLKRAAQVVVLTAVLVFSGLLVVNSNFITEDAEAVAPEPVDYHVTLYKYYIWWGNHAPHITRYYIYADYMN